MTKKEIKERLEKIRQPCQDHLARVIAFLSNGPRHPESAVNARSREAIEQIFQQVEAVLSLPDFTFRAVNEVSPALEHLKEKLASHEVRMPPIPRLFASTPEMQEGRENFWGPPTLKADIVRRAEETEQLRTVVEDGRRQEEQGRREDGAYHGTGFDGIAAQTARLQGEEPDLTTSFAVQNMPLVVEEEGPCSTCGGTRCVPHGSSGVMDCPECGGEG